MKSKSLKPAARKRSVAPFVLGLLGWLYFLLLGATIAYVWVIAQDRFVSISSFKISRQNPSSGELGIAGLALPGLSDSGSADSQVAIGFVTSSDLLFDLEKEFDLQRHYTSPPRDLAFRLVPDALAEERLEYYRARISAHFDRETGLTMLSVDTFDPALSKKVAETVLRKTADFINKMNQSVASQQSEFIYSEMARSGKQVDEIVAEILQLQNDNNLVAPQEAITAILRAIQELRVDKLRIQATLDTIERDSPGSPRIQTLQSQLRSIEEQISIEMAKVSGPEKDRLNQVLARFKQLEMKMEFANKLHLGAASMLEKNRMDAAATSRFISIIQNPYLPEDVTYPRRPYATVTILVAGLLLFLMLRILVKSVYEHKS